MSIAIREPWHLLSRINRELDGAYATAEGYERRERVTGSFTRRFTLPDNVQTDAIKAKFTHGVLEVSIPKQAVVAPKRVVVEAA